MVDVPAGAFWMGCNEALDTCFNDEHPYHQVTLSAYRIDRTEVTMDAYGGCFEDGECPPPDTGDACNWGVSGREEHPVNCVTWNDATAYCAWAGKRLPTEAEAEKAARGTDGQLYPWGNDEPTCSKANLNYCQSGTVPVGSYPNWVSPYGALDMAGNVWEWVSDWYGASYYTSSPTMDPQGPGEGSDRVQRGGSWISSPRNLRASNRHRVGQGDQDDVSGFRCVSDP
jgi:formylglycine-generating enzyme required for sulfatase activity